MYPRKYQKSAIKFLASRPGALVGDQVGLGKTATAIWAVLDVYEQTEDTSMRVLVICPRLHKDFWMSEIEKLMHLTGTRTDQYPKTPVLHTTDQHYDIEWTFAHYEQFVGRNEPSHLTQRYLPTKWDIIICDEIHKLKNRKAQRTKWIKRLKADRKWGLTASFASERAPDMWSTLHWIAPKRFQYFWPWVETYCAVWNDERGGYRKVSDVRPDRLARLRQELAPYFLARKLEDVGLELPSLTLTDVPLELGEAHAKFYDKVRTEVLVELEGVVKKQGLLDLTDIGNSVLLINSQIARMTRLTQVLSDPTVFKQDVPQVKYEWLDEYIDNGGDPALVFTRFNHTKDNLITYLRSKGLKINEQDSRGKWVKDSWIVGTWAKFAESHNLQHLHIVIAWDTTLSFRVWEQGLGRTHRSGQHHPVQVYRLVSILPNTRRHSVEQKITTLIDKKATTNQILMEWLRGLRDDEL